MKDLNDLFKDYNDSIMLHDSDYDKMREKRDITLDEIKNNLDNLTFSYINLGSYKLKTGVKYKDNDYDIDCGIRLNILESDLEKYDANECKKSVYDAISNHKEKKFKTKCLTAIYIKDGNPNYHIDFPIFAYDDQTKKYYLADGKQDDVKWVESKPNDLIEYLQSKNTDYKRIIRLLKKWNNNAFANKRKNSKTPSIALTLEAKEWFDSFFFDNDLDTLIEIANRLKNLVINGHISKCHPFSSDNIYYKMDADEKCVSIFLEEVKKLHNTLIEAKNIKKSSLYECCCILRKIFPDFPEPEKEESNESFSKSAKYA
ncbi:MAG: hypothetical protein J1F31_01870 [Erysipelotrichales bacterium]|nr:hypothetical protein [Erysipelotrichales bacterium]